MRANELDGVLAFLRAAEALKTVTRSGWTSAGDQESVAEHTWRLCLMAMLLELVAPLPADLRQEIVELWDEYEAANSPEAKIAKGLDKLETILQHTQGKNPADFDYAYNLDYGQRYTAADPVLAALRARLDEETARRARESNPRGADQSNP